MKNIGNSFHKKKKKTKKNEMEVEKSPLFAVFMAISETFFVILQQFSCISI